MGLLCDSLLWSGSLLLLLYSCSCSNEHKSAIKNGRIKVVAQVIQWATIPTNVQWRVHYGNVYVYRLIHALKWYSFELKYLPNQQVEEQRDTCRRTNKMNSSVSTPGICSVFELRNIGVGG